MVINGFDLLSLAPIKDMESTKQNRFGVSYGLGEAGYDIRIKQAIQFHPQGYPGYSDSALVTSKWRDKNGDQYGEWHLERFTLASAIEEFQMPENLMGIVHDKSTWARKGLSVFNTVIEPGWKGFLTLELVYHGSTPLHIPAGAGIAQVVFHELKCTAAYNGKYQNQENKPVPAKSAGV